MRPRFAILAATAVIGLGVGLAHAGPPASHTVHRKQLVDGKLSMEIHDGALAPKKVTAETVYLTLKGIDSPWKLRCEVKHPGPVQVTEYLKGLLNSYQKTGLKVSATVAGGAFEFIVKPDPAGDYKYKLEFPGNKKAKIKSCTAETFQP